MEIVCHRCHRPVLDEASFCPSCGLPQLVYETTEGAEPQSAASWPPPPPDAGMVEWRRALPIAILFAIPCGILSNMLNLLGVFLVALAALFVVMVYMRNRHPAWITAGAGLRIGLVTGLCSGWIAVASTGMELFANRYWLHQGKVFDDLWTMLAGQQVPEQLAAAGWDAQMVALQRAKMLTPEGQAGWTVGILLFLAFIMLPFAAAGGALGARLVIRTRRSQF